MKEPGRSLRLMIFVREDDIWHHKPVYAEIVHRVHQYGLAGATVVRGIEGYGITSHIHTARLFRLREDVPVVVMIVDAEDRVRGFLPEIADLVTSGLVVLDEVEVVHHEAADQCPRRQPG